MKIIKNTAKILLTVVSAYYLENQSFFLTCRYAKCCKQCSTPVVLGKNLGAQTGDTLSKYFSKFIEIEKNKTIR